MTQKKPNGPCPFGAYRQHEWMIRADNDVVECNLCQAAANIGLFAAAPDLLAAAEQVRAWLTSGIKFVGQQGEETPDFPVQWLSAAIAKTKGE